MKAKPTLYELLGVPQAAAVPEIQAAFRREMNALEAQRSTLEPQEFGDRIQLLRVAYSTLIDPVSRTGYDSALETAAQATPAGAATRALALRAQADAAPAAGADVRVDALALKAEALSLQVDALLARTGLELSPQRGGAGRFLAGSVLSGMKRVVRAIGLLVVIGFGAFMVARCSFAGSEQRRAAQQAQAAEQAALQEYYQSHGVRPANRAELELLEADRQRKENEQRQGAQDRRQQEEQLRRFEEDARRQGREISDQLRRSEEQQRYEALREEETKRAREQVQRENERLRLESERRAWRETLRR